MSSQRFDEMGDSIDLAVLDWSAAAHSLLSIDDVTFISVEGEAVPELGRRLKTDEVDRRVGEAALLSTLRSRVATFRKTPAVVEALLPLLSAADYSVFHLNLHDDDTRLVQAYDWGAGCCPVSLDMRLRPVAESLVESGAAVVWEDDAP